MDGACQTKPAADLGTFDRARRQRGRPERPPSAKHPCRERRLCTRRPPAEMQRLLEHRVAWLQPSSQLWRSSITALLFLAAIASWALMWSRRGF